MKKLPSPCIDICKFRRKGPGGDHCIGCSMTKSQKRMFKALKKPEHQATFIAFVRLQQDAMSKYRHWEPAFAKKCAKKGVRPPKTAA